MSPFLPAILAAWGARVAEEAPWRVPLALLVGCVVVGATRRRWAGPRSLRWALLAAIVVGGVAGAARSASVTDDAFVSLRYARNLLDGQGLVFNAGEPVEGETNLGWVLLVAAASGLTGVELPLCAVVLNLALVGANLGVCAWRGARAATRAGRAAPTIPVGAALLALSPVFLSYGTTGLETGLAALLVQLGAEGVAAGAPGMAGLALALAWTTRPDLGIFWAVGALGFAAPVVARGVRPDRRDLRGLGRYLASGAILAGVTGWRAAYYGDIVPNTAYAKSASVPYWSQGVVYGVEHWLGAWGWTLLVGGGAWLATARSGRRARWFVGLSVALQLLYVTRLGGDFMAGRFFVCLLPLLALAGEEALATLSASGERPWARGTLAAVLTLGVWGRSLVPPGTGRWYLADEGSCYPVVAWSPLRVGHSAWRMGVAVGRSWADRGIEVRMSSGTIGMLGYYGREPLVDHHGLTDREVARQPIGARGRPGHEKFATEVYLEQRGVQISQSTRMCHKGPHADVRALKYKRKAVEDLPMCWLRWDPALAARLREEAPEWTFVDFPAWLDRWFDRAPGLPPETLRADAAWIEAYYFANVDDPPRRLRLDLLTGTGGR